MSLSTQTRNIFGSVDLPKDREKDEFLNSLVTYVASISTEYYIITHDKDVTDNGELKHIHYHFCYKHINDRIRVSTHITTMADMLNINAQLVTMDKWNSYELGIQYLIHKNDALKYHYNISDIITNMSEQVLTIIINKEMNTDKIDIDYLIKLAKKYNYATDIYRQIGIVDAMKYRNLIRDILDDKKCGYTFLNGCPFRETDLVDIERDMKKLTNE